MRWQCCEGHNFEMALTQVRLGQWCKSCSSGYGERVVRFIFEALFETQFPTVWPEWMKKNKSYVHGLELDGYNVDIKIAFEHQGEQHYKPVLFGGDGGKKRSQKLFEKVIKHDQDKAKLCSDHGVKLIIVPQIPKLLTWDKIEKYLADEFYKNNIKFNKPKLRRILAGINPSQFWRIDKTKNFQDILNARDILLLDHYKGWEQKHKFKCLKCDNHWSALISNVAKKKDPRGCPSCGIKQRANKARKGNQKLLVENLVKRNISLLSSTYHGLTDKYDFQCLICKHIWKTTARSVLGHASRKASGCPICAKANAGASQKLGIALMKELAKKQNGKCLSSVYKNSTKVLEWQCSQGHRWSATPNVIKGNKLRKGRWCPKCQKTSSD